MRQIILRVIFILSIVFIFNGCDPSIEIGKREIEPDREIFVVHGLGQSIGYYDIDEDIFHMETPSGAPFLVGSSPNQLIIDKDRNLLYSVNSLDNSITYLNLSTLEWIEDVYLGVGINPWNMSINSDNPSVAYISGWMSNEIIVFDLIRKELIERITIAEYGSHPEGIVYYQGYLYTTYISLSNNTFGDGGVLVYEVSDEGLQFVEDIKTGVGSNPQSMFVDETNDSLHVICTGVNDENLAISNDGTVEIFNISIDGRLSHVSSLSIGGAPLFSPSGIDKSNNVVYLTNTGGYITSYYSSTHTVIHSAMNPLYEDDEVELFGAVTFVDDTLIISAFSKDSLLFVHKDGTLVKTIDSGDGPQFMILKEN